MIQAFDSFCNRAATFLDHHPILYKTALIISHIFRGAMVFAMIYISPLIGLATMIPLSLIYRISIERFCIFRFTLPSLFGGISLYLSHLTPLGFIPLTAYSIMICKTSNDDINNHLKGRKSCCKQ